MCHIEAEHAVGERKHRDWFRSHDTTTLKRNIRGFPLPLTIIHTTYNLYIYYVWYYFQVAGCSDWRMTTCDICFTPTPSGQTQSQLHNHALENCSMRTAIKMTSTIIQTQKGISRPRRVPVRRTRRIIANQWKPQPWYFIKFKESVLSSAKC